MIQQPSRNGSKGEPPVVFGVSCVANDFLESILPESFIAVAWDDDRTGSNTHHLKFPLREADERKKPKK